MSIHEQVKTSLTSLTSFIPHKKASLLVPLKPHISTKNLDTIASEVTPAKQDLNFQPEENVKASKVMSPEVLANLEKMIAQT